MSSWTLEESLVVAEEIGAIFAALNVRHAIGGSVASSLHGYPRATMAVDLVAALPSSRVDDFVRALGDRYYVDPISVREAVLREDSFNIIHNETILKVDVFVVCDVAFAREELDRANEVTTVTGQRLWVVSAEDIVVEKLRWWRRGGGISDPQWPDVTGVLEEQGEAFDFVYAERRAADLGVSDLLARARADVT